MKRRPESGRCHSEQVFEGLSLEGGEVASAEFRECEFAHGAFQEATLRACTFVECVFRECDLSLARLPHCHFTAVRFEKCKAIGVNWAESRWPEKRIWTPLEFRACVLDHSTFLGLDLKGVRFEECSAKDVDFREADLSESTFRGTDLEGSLFAETNLSGADLRGAVNYLIASGSNKLKGARFSLPEAMSLLAAMDIKIDDWD